MASYLAQKLLIPEDVEDILQETVSIALAQGERTDIRSAKSYLFVVARNLMSKRLKAQSVEMAREIDNLDLMTLPSTDATIEQQVDSKNAFHGFLRRVNALPPQCRRVFLLRKVLGWSHKKIAAHLRISSSTVERHITNALTRLDSRKGAPFGATDVDSEVAYTRNKSK